MDKDGVRVYEKVKKEKFTQLSDHYGISTSITYFSPDLLFEDIWFEDIID